MSKGHFFFPSRVSFSRLSLQFLSIFPLQPFLITSSAHFFLQIYHQYCWLVHAREKPSIFTYDTNWTPVPADYMELCCNSPVHSNWDSNQSYIYTEDILPEPPIPHRLIYSSSIKTPLKKTDLALRTEFNTKYIIIECCYFTFCTHIAVFMQDISWQTRSQLPSVGMADAVRHDEKSQNIHTFRMS